MKATLLQASPTFEKEEGATYYGSSCFRQARDDDWFVYKEIKCKTCKAVYTYEPESSVHISGKNTIFGTCPMCGRSQFLFRNKLSNVLLNY